MKREIEVVVISDVHLGSSISRAKELLDYLSNIQPKTLIINGDFIEIRHFKNKNFPTLHVEVIQELLKLTLRGTKVFYITGNHDEALRHFSKFTTNMISLRDSLDLCLRGKRYAIFHGDGFDYTLKNKWYKVINYWSYKRLIGLSNIVNKVRHFFRIAPLSLTNQDKTNVNKKTFLIEFENAALTYAEKHGYDTVICGHTHNPQIKRFDTGKGVITYLNSGDWVHNLTALEFNYDKWSIYHYDELDFPKPNPKLYVEPIKKEVFSKPNQMAYID
ncbi:MAG: hypothetical protein RLZZ292_1115 [Bacteroidota bacterium]|jgi:UDP-2,3-diacylglucosamine pyrophosphatase LpxH